jgi:NMD protein affecting ribosome stability and mRNA decay
MNCPHGRDPRACPTCAPELVERFKTIAEAFAIVRELARCTHAATPQALGVGGVDAVLCRMCGAQRHRGVWTPAGLGARAKRLDAAADLSSPFRAS